MRKGFYILIPLVILSTLFYSNREEVERRKEIGKVKDVSVAEMSAPISPTIHKPSRTLHDLPERVRSAVGNSSTPDLELSGDVHLSRNGPLGDMVIKNPESGVPPVNAHPDEVALFNSIRDNMPNAFLSGPQSPRAVFSGSKPESN